MRFIHASFDLLLSFGCTGVGGCALQLEWWERGGGMCGICKLKLVIVNNISHLISLWTLYVFILIFNVCPTLVLTRFIAFNFCACFTSALKLRQNSQGESKEHKLN